jgi:signal peptidase I
MLDRAHAPSESGAMDDAEPATAPAAPPAPAATDPARPEKKKETWGETLRFFLYLFLGAVLLRSFVIAPFSIPSGSMLPNLMIGDYLFISKWPYGYSRYSIPFAPFNFHGRVPPRLPSRGDVIVFRYPGDGDEDYVKRVIGLPGDRIEVRGGIVILNGRPLARERIADYAMPVTPNSPCRAVPGSTARMEGNVCLYPQYRETLPEGRSYNIIDQTDTSDGDEFLPITVPADRLFVMGDNRDDSEDSRFDTSVQGVGLLPVDNVLGEALVGFWSTDGSASWVKPWTWFTAARWSRIGETW